MRFFFIFWLIFVLWNKDFLWTLICVSRNPLFLLFDVFRWLLNFRWWFFLDAWNVWFFIVILFNLSFIVLRLFVGFLFAEIRLFWLCLLRSFHFCAIISNDVLYLLIFSDFIKLWCWFLYFLVQFDLFYFYILLFFCIVSFLSFGMIFLFRLFPWWLAKYVLTFLGWLSHFIWIVWRNVVITEIFYFFLVPVLVDLLLDLILKYCDFWLLKVLSVKKLRFGIQFVFIS